MKKKVVAALEERLSQDPFVIDIRKRISTLKDVGEFNFYLSGGYIQHILYGIEYDDIDVFVCGQVKRRARANAVYTLDDRKKEVEKAQNKIAFCFFGGKTEKMNPLTNDETLSVYQKQFVVYNGEIRGTKAQLIFHNYVPEFDFKFLEVFYNLVTGKFEGTGLEFDGFGVEDARHLTNNWCVPSQLQRFFKYLRRGVPLRDDFYQQLREMETGKMGYWWESQFSIHNKPEAKKLELIFLGFAMEQGFGEVFMPDQPAEIARGRMLWDENRFEIKTKKGLSHVYKNTSDRNPSDWYFDAASVWKAF